MRLAPLFPLLLTALPADAAIFSIGDYAALFRGVELADVAIRSDAGDSVAHLARIDLTDPAISFTGPRKAGEKEALAQQTSTFMTEIGAQFAVNASFFLPCCAAANEPKNIEGLAITDGVVVSALEPGKFGSFATMLMTADKAVTIEEVTTAPTGIDDAFTGSHILMAEGAVKTSFDVKGELGFLAPNPRTAAGVSKDGATLYLAVIDGRQPGYSVGATLSETAALMEAAGAWSALNLDGGGSSAMAYEGADGAVVANRPSGGEQRYNGGSLAVYAAPLPAAVPLPAALPMLLAGLAALGVLRRR